MKFIGSIRLAIMIPSTTVAILCWGGALLQAQQLPAAKPTAAVTASASSGPAAVPVKSQLSVDYAAGKLSVTASNASLDQILSEVSSRIGMKITGGVADERVFGQYGPSAPATVLADLLDGTGSNMLLVDDAKGPTELILTPRQGGPTPPSPASSRPEAAEEDPAPTPEHPREGPSPASQVPRIALRRGMGHPPTPGSNLDSGLDDSAQPDPAQSPNEIKSPQQIDAIRQMQEEDLMEAAP